MKLSKQDEFAALSQRLNEWRAQGNRRRIPEDIWRDAVELASRVGVYATSQATGLAYSRLRQRCKAGGMGEELGMADAESVGTLENTAGASEMFVSLGSTRTGGSAIVFEVTNTRGERLRIESSGALDTMGLTRTFLGRETCCR